MRDIVGFAMGLHVTLNDVDATGSRKQEKKLEVIQVGWWRIILPRSGPVRRGLLGTSSIDRTSGCNETGRNLLDSMIHDLVFWLFMEVTIF